MKMLQLSIFSQLYISSDHQNYIGCVLLMKNFRFAFTFPNSSKAVKMISSRPCTEESSKSALLSIADYIIESFPFLVPPFKFDGEWLKPNVTEEQPWEGGIFHPYYEIWQDVLIDRVTRGYAVRQKDILFVDIELNEPDLGAFKIKNSFEEITVDYQGLSPQKKVQKIFELPDIQLQKKRYMIMATHHFQREGFPFSMRICKDAILLGALFNNEQWKIVYFGKGEIPSAEQIASYDSIIMPGSMSSVLTWTPQMQMYFVNTERAMELNPHLRVIGICFGFQALAQFFGGKVEYKGRKGGIEKIDFNKVLFDKYGFMRELPSEQPWLVSQYHEDDVTILPEGFSLLGRSASCAIEGMIGREGRVVGLQFHTEYFPKYTKTYQDRYNYYYKNPTALQTFYLPSSPEIEKLSMTHSQKFYSFFKAFMRGDP